MYAYGAGSSGEGRPYQGYPYVNPVTSDVGTIDAATAARWAALPRRPVAPRVHEQGSSSREIPRRNPASPTIREQSSGDSPTEVKIDYDANPVVYIDLPENCGSEVAEQRRPQTEDSFVQQTIFYDQFKDCTVVTMSDTQSCGSSSSSTTSFPRPNRPTRPAPPVTLSLGSPDSGYPSQRSTPGAPPIMSKEASIYGNQSLDDAFTQSIPELREFPNPPPAYSEYHLSSRPGTPPISRQPTPAPIIQTPSPESPVVLNPANLPRTQVLGPATDKKTKVIFCNQCRENTQIFTIQQVGFATHVLAFILFVLGLLPCTLVLYFSNYCRYKNHYCTHCNKLVAYEIPFLKKHLTYLP